MDLVFVQVRIREIILDGSLLFFKSSMHFRLNHLRKLLLVDHALFDIPEIVLIIILLLFAKTIFKGLIELLVEIGVLVLHLDEVLLHRPTIPLDLNRVESIEDSWQKVFLRIHDLSILVINFGVYFVAVRCMGHVLVHQSLLIQLLVSINVRILDQVLSLRLFQYVGEWIAFVPCKLSVGFLLLLGFEVIIINILVFDPSLHGVGA